MSELAEPDRADAGATPGAPGVRTRLRRGRRLAAIAVTAVAAAALLGLLTFGVLVQAPNTTIDDGLAQGRAAPAPAFDLAVLQRGDVGAALNRRLAPALAGGRLGIRGLRGIPVVLNIWASWCVPCKQEAPLLEHAWRTEGRPGGTLFLGLDQQDLTGDARVFMRSYGVDYTNVRDPENEVPRSYGTTGIPETYFISARGDVVDHVIGVVSPRELRDGILAARSGQPLGARSGGAHRPSR